MRARKQAPPSVVHKSVYWDACIWIAWLSDEARDEGEMDGVFESVNHVQAGRADLIVSRYMENEVLDGAMGEEAVSTFHKLLKRPNIVWVDYEPPVLTLVKEIREFYAREKSMGVATKIPGTADAFHLATAINRKAEAFYTFDKGGHGDAGLLKLNGSVAGHPLTICKPPFEQYKLFAKRRPPKR